MKHSLSVKFIAVFLCTLALLSAAGCAVGLALMANRGILQGKNPRQARQERIGEAAEDLALRTVSVWAGVEYGNMPEEMIGSDFEGRGALRAIRSADGEELFCAGSEEVSSTEEAEEPITVRLDRVPYFRFLRFADEEQTEASSESAAQNIFCVSEGLSRPVIAAEEIVPESLEVTLLPGELLSPAEENVWQLLTLVGMRKTRIALIMAISLLLFAVSAVYLCACAGHRPGSEEIKPAGFNALPLDLYAGLVFCAECLLAALASETARGIIQQAWQTWMLCFGAMGFAACLLLVAFCFAVAAQVKLPGMYWWHNSLTGRCGKLLLRFARACFGLLPRICRALWKIAAALCLFALDAWRRLWNTLCRLTGRLFRGIEHFFGLLPVMWQWLLVGMALLAALVIAVASRSEGLLAAGCIAGGLIVGYGANVFGILLSAVRQMRSGSLECKVDDRLMVGAFREFAGELNGLADVAVAAARKQLQSERMKTELITNVSHDIKTPLTSIINYVDLLEKPHTPEEEKTYLEVLHRQSQRMKKLIDDLMEMSKASTGNIPVETSRIDVVEAVNQVLGEFDDKLNAAGLTPVFSKCAEEVPVLADGRLLWRAMSNILSNAVKYSLPGTRLYADVSRAGERVLVSFKNISGAQLNISAEELMERFVRGDSSRNTEGSGLGLNIAKSLMELQKGELLLLVDGDLFKVTLVFPAGEETA